MSATKYEEDVSRDEMDQEEEEEERDEDSEEDDDDSEVEEEEEVEEVEDPMDVAPSGSSSGSSSSSSSSSSSNNSSSSSSSAINSGGSLVGNGILAPQADAVVRPVLRGKLTMETGGMVICKGFWAYTDAQHDANDPSLLNAFEFRRVDAIRTDEGGISPRDCSGKYTGWFRLANMPESIHEKDLRMSFVPGVDFAYTITGEGSNRFGHFNLVGTLSSSNDLSVRREYLVISKAKLKKLVNQNSTSALNPRESTGRVRKVSSLLVQQDDFGVVPIRTGNGGGGKGASSSSSSSAGKSNKGVRTPFDALACQEILTYIIEHPSALWFRTPVDVSVYPDYPERIAEPMDLGTINENLQKNVYETMEAFESKVKLVFSNAKAYNKTKESVVAKAAKDLSKLFQERCQALKHGKAPKRSKTSGEGQRTTKTKVPIPDELLEMQKAMKKMENELKTLKAAQAKGGEGTSSGGSSSSSSRSKKAKVEVTAAFEATPLTREEKEQLVKRIQKLPENNMNRIIQLIQESLPVVEPVAPGENHVDIALDSIDTYTLRRLQGYVESIERRTASINSKKATV